MWLREHVERNTAKKQNREVKCGTELRERNKKELKEDEIK